jgi:hypothetical protein
MRSFGAMLLCAAVLTGVRAALAEPTLDPYKVTSPSGKIVLSVTPSDMDGSGSAQYIVADRGKPLWQLTHPFTLWKAEVADDGTVCGFAYNNGHDGRGRGGKQEEAQLLCVLIDRRGTVRAEDPHPRHHPAVMSNPPSPYEPLGLGVTVDAAQDRFLVRAAGTWDDDAVRWWVYRLSTGDSLGEVVPDQPAKPANGLGFHKEISAALVPGTPLLLVHWFIYQHGARFALLDPKGKEVWSLDQPEEYATQGERFSWWDLQEKGIRQTTLRDKAFDIISYTLKARVAYQVSPDAAAATGFSVKETNRAEEAPAPKPADPSGALTDLVLEPAGAITLQAPTPSSPIDNVHDFNIDAEGRLGFIRAEFGEKPRFVLVAPDGTIVLNLPLDLPADPKAQAPAAAPVSADRWVIARGSYEEGKPALAWWLDLNTKALTPFADFKAASVKALRGVAGGGFAVEQSYRDAESVVVYDAKGQRSGAVGAIENGMMQSAAVRTDGSIAVITAVSKTLESFDKNGTFERSQKLATLLGSEPNYPSSVRPDCAGGIIVEDFNGSPPIYRVAADGTLTAKFAPKFPDGRVFRVMGGVQGAPDGAAWTSDGHSLLRLNKEGVVDRVLGPAPTADDLSRVSALAVGPNGLIYAIDARTSAVHVFDATGRRVRVCRPAAGDFPSDHAADQIAVAADNSVWIHSRMGSFMEPSRYYGFGVDGGRVDPKSAHLDHITETWHYQPHAGRRWSLGYESIWLVDDKDDIVQTITHRPSGAWLGHVDEGAVAPDGSLAVIAGPREMGMRGPAELNIYSPAGEPVKTIPLPDTWIGMRVAFNGRWAITASDAELHLYNVESGARNRFPIPAAGGDKHFWYPFVSPDGTEVWLQDSGGTTLTRYKLPA